MGSLSEEAQPVALLPPKKSDPEGQPPLANLYLQHDGPLGRFIPLAAWLR